MPKNKGAGGKKFRSNKKNYGHEVRNTILKDSEQNYAIVTKVCGACRFQLTMDNGSKVLGILCGSMKKKRIWENENDLILVSRRDYENDKVDIIGKYTTDEWEYLRSIEPSLDILIGEKKTEENTEYFTQGEVMEMELDDKSDDKSDDLDEDGDNYNIDNL